MTRKKIIPILTVIALGAAAVAGVFGYRAVYAQAATPTATAPAQSGQSSGTSGTTAQPLQPGLDKHGPMGDQVSNTDLAAALGITTDQLTAAYQTANTEALKQAVAKGLITQAQADQYAAGTTSGKPIRPFDFGQFANSGIDYNALLAQALNITTDQLKAAQTTAFNTAIDNAVKNGTMTQDQADLAKARRALQNDSNFQANLKSAYEAALKQAVTDGTITQAQADLLIQAESQMPGGMGGGFGFDMGRGGHGGHGGPMMPPDSTSSNSGSGTSTTPATPQVTPNSSGL